MFCFSFVFWGVLNITRGKPNDGVLLQLFFVMSMNWGDKLVKQSDRALTNYEINILWWGRCKGMPILGVCWKFFLLEWTITYHLSLSSFFAAFGDCRFWAHHQLLSWHCGCNKSCFGHPTSCFVWNFLEHTIPLHFWHWHNRLDFAHLERDVSSWKSKAKRDGNIRKIRILSRVNHSPTWRGFFANKKIIGRGKSRKIGIIFYF